MLRLYRPSRGRWGDVTQIFPAAFLLQPPDKFVTHSLDRHFLSGNQEQQRGDEAGYVGLVVANSPAVGTEANARKPPTLHVQTPQSTVPPRFHCECSVGCVEKRKYGIENIPLCRDIQFAVRTGRRGWDVWIQHFF